MLKNSGGMALAVNNSSDSDNIEILENNNKLSFWFKVKKEHIYLEKYFIMVVVHFPPVGSEYNNGECFEILQNDIKFYNPNESYLLPTGDLNSKTKNISETAQTDTELLEVCNIDRNDVKNNDNPAYATTILEELGITICRKSPDANGDAFGDRLIELCENNNLIILNGRVGEDQNIGNFATTRNSVVDYKIMSANSLKYLSTFKVHKFDPLCQTSIVLFLVIYLQNIKPICTVTIQTVKEKIMKMKKSKRKKWRILKQNVNGQS